MRPALPSDLEEFLADVRDAREYRRGIAVKMALQHYEYPDICAILGVTPGFISQNKRKYLENGVAGLQLQYQGGHAFLTPEQRSSIIVWLQAQKTWSLVLLQQYITETYDITYQSLQSYYDLLDAAGLSYKRTQATNPQGDPEAIAQKKKRS